MKRYATLLLVTLITLALSGPLLWAQGDPFAQQAEQATVLISANGDKKQRRCDKARTRLEKIRDRMRSGYKAKQYNGLVKKERRYKADINKYCN